MFLQAGPPSSFEWLTFGLAVFALVVAMGGAAFEVYRWLVERSESEPNLVVGLEHVSWGQEFPRYFTARHDLPPLDLDEPGEVPTFVVATAVNTGGSGAEVVDVQMIVGGIGLQPDAPFDRPSDLATFGVYQLDRLPVFIGPGRTARWWWDLRVEVEKWPGVTEDAKRTRAELVNSASELVLLVRTAVDGEIKNAVEIPNRWRAPKSSPGES